MTNRALEARLQTAAKAARLRRLERARSYLQHRFNRLQLMGAYPETLATVRALCIAGFCVNQGGEVNPGAIEDRCQQFLRRQKKAMAARPRPARPAGNSRWCAEQQNGAEKGCLMCRSALFQRLSRCPF